ncbi:hypothetical protein C8F04DRAFT_1180872 [Mycena alexandri]|uniref:Uncharacterized protein n=1 Tax=Mycena alexandri TaxID=1745969 RepID=A0AAD6T011_9AGAR|nr:hypothetical protein C8F04DRAFT_1180872 [Mycena alexandri]
MRTYTDLHPPTQNVHRVYTVCLRWIYRKVLLPNPRWDPNLPAAIAAHLPTLPGIKIRHSRILHPDDESDLPGKRLRVKHLTAVPVAVLPEELVLSHNTMFTDMRRTYHDMGLICICITASGVHGQGEDPRFKMHMNVVAPELAPPDLKVLVRSASCGEDRLVTPDLDLLYSLPSQTLELEVFFVVR